MTTHILKDRNDQGEYVTNNNRSNQLIYKESILSVMVFNLPNFDIQAGLRAEYINYNATSLTSNNTNKDNYLSLFPSFSINGISKRSIQIFIQPPYSKTALLVLESLF
jgi:hypothetical protein